MGERATTFGFDHDAHRFKFEPARTRREALQTRMRAVTRNRWFDFISGLISLQLRLKQEEVILALFLLIRDLTSLRYRALRVFAINEDRRGAENAYRQISFKVVDSQFSCFDTTYQLSKLRILYFQRVRDQRASLRRY